MPTIARLDAAASRSRVRFGCRTLVLRRAGVALRWRLHTLVVCAGTVAATAATTVWTLTTGDYPLTLADVWAVLTRNPPTEFTRIVVVEWRLPRALAAAVFGAALGAAGAVFQSLTRNPLASPDIIGFSTGSYTGALLVIIVLGGSYPQLVAGALAGGITTAAVVYSLAWRRGVHGFRLIIVGIAISAVLASVNTWLMLTADLEIAMTAAAWGAGSLAGIGWEQVGIGSTVVVLLLTVLVALAPGLRQLELGDDVARATGVRAESLRMRVIVIGVALTAVVTAAAGPIAFIALAAPQIARRLTATPGTAVVPAACVGGLLLAGADHAARTLLPVALPVGVVTVIVGGSYLVWLIAREVRRRA